MTDKLEKQEQEVFELRTDFNSFREATNGKLDDIISKLKPQFTNIQIMSFLLTLTVVMSGVMIYITNIKSDARNNTTRIDNFEDAENIRNIQYNNIMETLTEIKTDVAVLKNE